MRVLEECVRCVSFNCVRCSPNACVTRSMREGWQVRVAYEANLMTAELSLFQLTNAANVSTFSNNKYVNSNYDHNGIKMS